MWRHVLWLSTRRLSVLTSSFFLVFFFSLNQSTRKYKGALRHYRALLDVSDGHAPALQRLALLLARQGDINGALRAWQRLVEVAPADVQAHREIARLFCLRGDSALKAEEHFLHALESEPADIETRLALADFYRETFHDLDAAYFHLTAARCAEPHSEEVRRKVFVKLISIAFLYQL